MLQGNLIAHGALWLQKCATCNDSAMLMPGTVLTENTRHIWQCRKKGWWSCISLSAASGHHCQQRTRFWYVTFTCVQQYIKHMLLKYWSSLSFLTINTCFKIKLMQFIATFSEGRSNRPPPRLANTDLATHQNGRISPFLIQCQFKYMNFLLCRH